VPLIIESLLQEFADIFTRTTSLPPHGDHNHEIPLKPDNKPHSIRPYKVPYKQNDEVEKLIQAMLKDELIRPSHNLYSSPAILVRKNDGSWRLCIDYKELNSQTIKNRFPIPVIENLLNEFHGAKLFTKLDLKSGYHQIRMKAKDIHKTAFKTYCGHFEFLVMARPLKLIAGTFS
jgi:hypothetical protein